MQAVTFQAPGEVRVEDKPEPELQDVRIVRGRADIDPERMPLFLQSFFGWVFDQR